MFSKSILVENNVDTDQTASREASCSGSTVLLKRIQSVKHDKVEVQQDLRVFFVPKTTKRSTNRLADPEYSIITKPAKCPDQTAPLGADFSWIISLFSMLFKKKRWGYCNRLHQSARLSVRYAISF